MNVSRRSMRRDSGFFGIACYRPKTEVNIGTLWRSAFLYNAGFIATVAARYHYQASDTPKTADHLPLLHYTDIDDLVAHLPHSCPLVGVELTDRAKLLPDYWHPPRAVYLLGAEDHGLPSSVLDRCHDVVEIPTPRDWSLNVAVAGSIVMYDRTIKRT